MARRRQNDSGAGFLVILAMIVATLIVVAMIFGVVALLGMWMWYEFRASEARKNRLADIVTMTPGEQQALAQAQAEVDLYEAELDQIEQQGSSLNRRNDGRYDERSGLGKQLNRDVERLSLLLASANNERDAAASVSANRLAAYRSAVTNCNALRLAVLVGVCLFLMTTQGAFGSLDDFGVWIGQTTFIDVLPEQHRFYGHAVVAFIASLIVWAIAKPIFSWKMKQQAMHLGYVP